MKIILVSKRDHYLVRVSVFLFMLALVTGMVACEEQLPISEIRTWYDLDAIRDNLGGHYILMNDLDSTTLGYEELASETANGGKGWQPIGTWTPPDDFRGLTGTFNGQGHEIRDLFINRPLEGFIGLFSIVNAEGVIERVGLVVDATASNSTDFGSLVGRNMGTVSDSHSSGRVAGFVAVGGLVGRNHGGTISNSYFTGTVTGSGLLGGLVGTNSGENYHQGIVRYSYFTGSVTGNTFVGGLVGQNSGNVIGSYFTGTVTGNARGIGGLVGTNMPTGNVGNSHFTGSVTGSGWVGGLVGWNTNGVVSSSYSTGSVTGDWSVGGLVGWNDDGSVSNSYYNYDEVLINGENVITIGALSGEDFEEWLVNGRSLDANERLSQENGYYVVNNVSDFKELLPFGQDSSLKFRLKNDLDLATESDFYIPYLAGEFDGNGHKISNLSFNFDIISHVGLFGYLASGAKVHNVAAENVNITACENVGGLVGYSHGVVGNSHSSGNVTGSTRVGGLVGTSWAFATVSNSHSTGSVTGESQVGGLVGFNDGPVSKSYSTGSLTGDVNVGGLVGWNVGAVSNSHSTGSVTGNEGVGGLVGQNWGAVSDSYATGSVTGSSHVGGLVGWTDGGAISDSYATGSVTGSSHVGGLVGWNDGGAVSDSYATGSVSGNSSVGGLVGWNDGGAVSDSYATGSVTGSSHVGGLVGDNFGMVRGSFWDTETSGQATSDRGTGKTTAEMQDISTFSDTETEGLDESWDIIAVANPGTRNPAYIWNIVDDETYPFLSWQP